MALHLSDESPEPKAEVVDLNIVRQVLAELFDPEKNETNQFELNIAQLESSVADPSLIRSIAAHGAFNNEAPKPLDAYRIVNQTINQGGNAA